LGDSLGHDTFNPQCAIINSEGHPLFQ
jgi:hypothetical protein